MKVWYFDIPKGIYTTEEVMSMAKPKQSYAAVYQTFRRLGVESYKVDPSSVDYNPKNEKYWEWLGAEFYLKMTAKDKADREARRELAKILRQEEKLLKRKTDRKTDLRLSRSKKDFVLEDGNKRRTNPNKKRNSSKKEQK